MSLPEPILAKKLELVGKLISVFGGEGGARSRRAGPPLIEMPPLIKIMTTKPILLLLFLSSFLRSTVVNNYIIILTTTGPGPHQLKFLPTDLNASPGKIQAFNPKGCNLWPSFKLFMNVMQ